VAEVRQMRADEGKEFPHVFLYRSSSGTQARVRGTGLAVWELVRLVRTLGSAVEVASHLEIDPALVEESLSYADQHPAGIEEAIGRHESLTLERLRSMLPGLTVSDASASD
jgi:uncharacterized protein (DUF433 family)